ncbi:Copper amine oxidase N-terminal domain-containing protein [Anaerosphaera aminiphila DSM 21120]|uniref:Copper amine oxidase N-terminal domain-containing protein n=1 Tax=Anaerosphaera aminiphila DSM 21120 TaxID=1120995 RepID=A0A1M5UZT5_9FIRM|nr:copper amine oxidase N-terminal domain-containing protein [Anaerosphaera aminiphila]SHH68404.1 Copper amine oxidase N-terminal domain-containing protein [Anaerosphaera aminiphila DSM 21120]
MKKKFVSLSLVLMMLVSLIPNYANAQQPIKLIVDGKEVKSDVAPYIQNGRTMVPVRFIGEALGMKVEFSEIEQNGYDNIPFVSLTTPNGRFISIDVSGVESDGLSFNTGNSDYNPSLIIRNNRIFVPIRYIANALHMDISWDKPTNTVELKTNNNNSVYPLYYVDEDFNEIKSDKIQVEYRNEQYLVKDSNYTLYDYSYAYWAELYGEEGFEKIALNNNTIFRNEFLKYGNVSFLMNSERTKIVGSFFVD